MVDLIKNIRLDELLEITCPNCKKVFKDRRCDCNVIYPNYLILALKVKELEEKLRDFKRKFDNIGNSLRMSSFTL